MWRLDIFFSAIARTKLPYVFVSFLQTSTSSFHPPSETNYLYKEVAVIQTHMARDGVYIIPYYQQNNI